MPHALQRWDPYLQGRGDATSLTELSRQGGTVYKSNTGTLGTTLFLATVRSGT